MPSTTDQHSLSQREEKHTESDNDEHQPLAPVGQVERVLIATKSASRGGQHVEQQTSGIARRRRDQNNVFPLDELEGSNNPGLLACGFAGLLVEAFHTGHAGFVVVGRRRHCSME